MRCKHRFDFFRLGTYHIPKPHFDGLRTACSFQGASSEAFFLPYLWELVLTRTLDLNWNTMKVRIFSPVRRAVPRLPDHPVEKAISDATVDEGLHMGGAKGLVRGDELTRPGAAAAGEEQADAVPGDLRV